MAEFIKIYNHLKFKKRENYKIIIGFFITMFICISLMCYSIYTNNDDYYKEEQYITGVINNVEPANTLTHFDAKFKIEVNVDTISEKIYFYTNKSFAKGDTINIKMIFYNKK